jgi:hypothetical protein
MRELSATKEKNSENDLIYGGGRGIRTLDTVSRIHTFQACAFNHSATPPQYALCAHNSHCPKRAGRWHTERHGSLISEDRRSL